MVIYTACLNLLSTFDFVRKCRFLLLMKAQITRKWISYIDRFTCIKDTPIDTLSQFNTKEYLFVK